MPDKSIDRVRGFTLIELLISVSIIAILSAAIIPSFTDFTGSQILTQAFKTLRSDLRTAQLHSLSGVTYGGDSKAWGINLVLNDNKYVVFVCNPVSNPSEYTEYVYSHPSRCPSVTSKVKTVSLGSKLKISAVPASPLSIVFDSQNGSIYSNGLVPTTDTTVTLSYNDGSSPMTVIISPSGGISD